MIKKMNKEQLIQIAKVAFPELVKQSINFDSLEMSHWHGVYRLYDKGLSFIHNLPKKCHLSIFIGEDKFVQIQVNNRAFNHYAAIKEMERMGIV